MIICIGPKGSGKTLFLRRLQHIDNHPEPHNEIFSTIPTVGVNIAKISFKKKKPNQLSVTELGGAMAPIWNMHFEGCLGVIYVIDASNVHQISCSMILLLETLKNDMLSNSKVLIVLNKVDISSSVSLEQVKYLLRIDDICHHAVQEITVVETSCLTGKGLTEVMQWLSAFCT